MEICPFFCIYYENDIKTPLIDNFCGCKILKNDV